MAHTREPYALGRGTGAAGTGRAAAASSAQLHLGADRKSHVGHVDLERRTLLVQIIFNDKGIAGNIQHRVRFARLIQSQRQSGASSAARGQVNPDGTFFFFGKVPVQLGLCAFRQFNHEDLLEVARLMQLSMTDRKVK